MSIIIVDSLITKKEFNYWTRLFFTLLVHVWYCKVLVRFLVLLFNVLYINLHFESILIDFCPEFNTGANTLVTVPCNASIGCPNVLFLSNEVYECKTFFLILVYLKFMFASTSILSKTKMNRYKPTQKKKIKFLRNVILLGLHCKDNF